MNLSLIGISSVSKEESSESNKVEITMIQIFSLYKYTFFGIFTQKVNCE